MAQFLEKVWTKRIVVLRLHHIAEGRRAPVDRERRIVDEAAIDLVGDDPEAVAAGKVEEPRADRRGSPSSRSGLEGELMTIARVRGVIAFSIRSKSRCQPFASMISGTATGLAPATEIAPAKFGQAGVGTITSSPLPATMRKAIWIACMPPEVTKKRSRVERLAVNRSW